MIGIERSSGECLWIDMTEVSVSEYQAFLDSSRDDPPPTGCEWNDEIAPTNCGGAGAPRNDASDAPVACVDFCDAAEFCSWAGKYLCRGEGVDAEDPDMSEWYFVCSSAGANDYPYGDNYETGACNDADRPGTGCAAEGGGCTTIAAGSLSRCKTSSKVMDLCGNVAEWVDECDSTSETATCRTRGGSVNDPAGVATCGQVLERPRDFKYFALGFRCCA
jgi:formylglycine-generating enzyme required for sulfatase activity